jgi:hypothetical protein
MPIDHAAARLIGLMTNTPCGPGTGTGRNLGAVNATTKSAYGPTSPGVGQSDAEGGTEDELTWT